MSEYDRRAEAWVRAKYPGANPDQGSVEFTSDVAGYASGGWASMTVDWREGGNIRSEELGGWGEFDWTAIIRELLELNLSTATIPKRQRRRESVFTTIWYPAGEENERAQVSSGQRGLYYAIHNMRRGLAESTITSARVIGHDQQAVYDSAAGVDLYPQCAWCPGAYCEDISAHYDRQAAAGRRPFYYEPMVSETEPLERSNSR